MTPDLTVSRGKPCKPSPPVRDVVHEAAVRPAWIATDLPACRAWDELAPACIAAGLLIALTQESFAHLCVYIGAFRAHPSAMRGPQRTDMRALMKAFRLTPTGRAAVKPRPARVGGVPAGERRLPAAKRRRMRGVDAAHNAPPER